MIPHNDVLTHRSRCRKRTSEGGAMSLLVVFLVGSVAVALVAAATHGYELDRNQQRVNMPLTTTSHIVGFTLSAAICIGTTSGPEPGVLVFMLIVGTIPFLGYVPVPARGKEATPAV